MGVKSLKFNKALSVLIICLCLVVFLSSCGEQKLDVATYLASVKNTSSVTRIVQTINITDENKLVSQTIIRVSAEDGKVESEVYNKSLTNDLTSASDYEESTEIVYFYNNNKYSFNGTEWVSEQGEYVSSLQVVDIKSADLENVKYNKSIKSTNTLTANIKNESLKSIFGQDFTGKNCSIELIINQKKKVLELNINYLTSTNKNVEITTSYSYEYVQVILPL